MKAYPGVLSHSENGVVVVYEQKLWHMKEQNGGYVFESYPVTPSSPRNYAMTLYIPDWMTNC